MKKIYEAIDRLTTWLRCNHQCATKRDLENAKTEIIAAFGRRDDPMRAKQLADDLRESAEPLAKAVEENKPPGVI